MLEVIKNFIAVYANVNNIFVIGLFVITALLITNFIMYLCSYSTLKKIIFCMRYNEGEDIIFAIEGIKKHGRYFLMWEDYYDAYKNENTVALDNYLIKNDLFVKRNVCKAVSRAVVVICIALMIAAYVKVTGFLKSEKYDIICGGGLLVGIQAVYEVLYYLIDTAKEKRLRRYLEELKMLSLRKLPGRAVDFAGMHYISKIDRVNETLKDIYSLEQDEPTYITPEQNEDRYIKTDTDFNFEPNNTEEQ